MTQDNMASALEKILKGTLQKSDSQVSVLQNFLTSSLTLLKSKLECFSSGRVFSGPSNVLVLPEPTLVEHVWLTPSKIFEEQDKASQGQTL